MGATILAYTELVLFARSWGKYNQHTKREISIDIDALLNAVADITGETVQEHEDNKEAHMVPIQGRQYTTFGELAEAYELDSRDFTVNEVNN